MTLHLPLDRGDLVAAAHREGEVLDTSVDDEFVTVRVVLDEVGAARFAEWRVVNVSFTPPPVPVRAPRRIASCRVASRGRSHRLLHRHPGGRATRLRDRRAGPSHGARGYPPSAGTPQYREACRGMDASALQRRDRRLDNWRRAWVPRSSSLRWRSTCTCDGAIATPCSIRRSRIPPTPWAPRWRVCARSKCRLKRRAVGPRQRSIR